MCRYSELPEQSNTFPRAGKSPSERFVLFRIFFPALCACLTVSHHKNVTYCGEVKLRFIALIILSYISHIFLSPTVLI